jgi:hypothetical protein
MREIEGTQLEFLKESIGGTGEICAVDIQIRPFKEGENMDLYWSEIDLEGVDAEVAGVIVACSEELYQMLTSDFMSRKVGDFYPPRGWNPRRGRPPVGKAVRRGDIYQGKEREAFEQEYQRRHL